MTMIGQPLDPWQASIVLDMFATRPGGMHAAFEIVCLLARQNGKGALTEARELGGLFLLRERLILHSAHLFKTSSDAFRRVIDLIDGSDWLRRRVKMISRSKGDEGVELVPSAGGGRLRFVARSLGSGRGMTASTLVFDEAYALTVGQHAAQTPTLATAHNPQIIYTSTPPDEDTGPMPEDAMLPSVRARGLAADPEMAYYEWSPPLNFKDDDLDVWYQCNPALGIRISEEFLSRQFRAFRAANRRGKFATEHLGQWPDDAGLRWSVISEADWLACLDDASQARDPLVFAVDITPERSHSTIAAVGARPDGDLHGEVVDHALGTSWLVERCVELNRKWRPAFWVIDVGGAAGYLAPQLEAENLIVQTMTTRQVGQAYGMFRSATSSQERADAPESAESLTGKPLDESEAETAQVPAIRVRPGRHGGALTSAVETAITRRVGDLTTWDRKTSQHVISPLVALTNALHGFVSRPPQPYFGAF